MSNIGVAALIVKAGAVLYFLFCVFIFSGSVLALNTEYTHSVRVGLIGFVSVWGALSLKYAKIPRALLPMVLLLGISGLVSLAAYLQLGSTDHAFFLFGFFLALMAVGSAGHRVASPQRLHTLSSFVCVAFFAILVASILQSDGFTQYRMQGIFDNPNSFAIFSSTVLVFSASMLMANYASTRCQRNLLLVTAIGSAVFLGFTQSRTAIIASSGVLVVGVIFAAIARGPRDKKLTLRSTIGIFLGVLTVGLIFLAGGAAESFLDKFANNFARGDVSSGRFESWLIQMRYANLLGYSDSYLDFFSSRGYDAVVGHSNYLDVLSRFGVIALSLYVTTLVGLIWLALYKIMIKRNVAFIVPLNLLLLYSVVGAALPQITSPALWLGVFVLFLMLRMREKDWGMRNQGAHVIGNS